MIKCHGWHRDYFDRITLDTRYRDKYAMSHPFVEHKTVDLMKIESEVMTVRERLERVRSKGMMGKHSSVSN